MKKILNLLLAFTICLPVFATGGMNFEKNMSWAQIKAKAARENKMIFFDAYTTWCGPCKYLEESVYSDQSVAEYFNANYINVKFDMEDGEGLDLAEEFEISSYPTLLFFSPEGKLVHKYIGAMKAPDFIQLGREAMMPSKQYFTIRQKVLDRQASTADFVKWAEMAEDLEDNNRGTLASDWLATQEDILANAELANAALLYSDANEEQLAYLYQNQDRIGALLGWDKDKISTTLYRKLFKYALEKGEPDTRGAGSFEGIIGRFNPGRLKYALIDLAMLNAIYDDRDIEKAMDILIGTITGADRLNLEEFCSLFIDYSPRFEIEQVTRLSGILDKFTIQSSDKGFECWFYLAQVICYSKSNEFVKAKEAAEKAYSHPNIPEQYKTILAETFELTN